MRVSIGLAALWRRRCRPSRSSPRAPPRRRRPWRSRRRPRRSRRSSASGSTWWRSTRASWTRTVGRCSAWGRRTSRSRWTGSPAGSSRSTTWAATWSPRLPEAPRPVHFSSNEDAPRGRLILLLVDRGNIGRGGGREVHEGGRALPGDARARRPRRARVRAGARASSSSSPRTSTLVRQGLKGVVGTADRSGWQVPLAEAVSYMKNRDRLRWQQWVDLNCDVRMALAGRGLPAADGGRGRPGLPRLPRALPFDDARPRLGPAGAEGHRGSEDGGLHLGGPGHGVDVRGARPRRGGGTRRR